MIISIRVAILEKRTDDMQDHKTGPIPPGFHVLSWVLFISFAVSKTNFTSWVPLLVEPIARWQKVYLEKAKGKRN